MIANLLASEGFLTIEDLVAAEVSEIASIEGFDEDVAGEIKNRAEEFLAKGGVLPESSEEDLTEEEPATEGEAAQEEVETSPAQEAAEEQLTESKAEESTSQEEVKEEEK